MERFLLLPIIPTRPVCCDCTRHTVSSCEISNFRCLSLCEKLRCVALKSKVEQVRVPIHPRFPFSAPSFLSQSERYPLRSWPSDSRSQCLNAGGRGPS